LFSLILRFEIQVFTKPNKQLKNCNAIEAHWRKPLQLAVSPSQLFQVGHGNYKETGVSARGGDPFYHWQLETSANKLK
jgi:hypothetical protein